jgi:hypothetical protein
MSSCASCDQPAKFVCFCADLELCDGCLPQHLIDNPTANHRPVPVTSPEILNVVRNVNNKRKLAESTLISDEFAWIEKKQGWTRKLAMELECAKVDAAQSVDQFKAETDALIE